MNNYFKISHNKEKHSVPVPFHSHDFYEIYFFVDGNVKYYIEDESYDLTKGDILIIPPGKLHRAVVRTDQPYDRYVLWIYSSYAASNAGIQQFLQAINAEISKKMTRLVSFKGSEFDEISQFFDNVKEKFSDTNYTSNGNMSSISTESGSNNLECTNSSSTVSQSDVLSSYVCDSCNILILEKILDKLLEISRSENIDNNIIRQVISYINRNVTDTPTLDELSSRFFVSKYYLSHQFREYTKMTIHQYILTKKINLAKELLDNGKSPQQVCDLCGFSTYSNFYKVFTRQTGLSPREYLK